MPHSSPWCCCRTKWDNRTSLLESHLVSSVAENTEWSAFSDRTIVKSPSSIAVHECRSLLRKGLECWSEWLFHLCIYHSWPLSYEKADRWYTGVIKICENEEAHERRKVTHIAWPSRSAGQMPTSAVLFSSEYSHSPSPALFWLFRFWLDATPASEHVIRMSLNRFHLKEPSGTALKLNKTLYKHETCF